MQAFATETLAHSKLVGCVNLCHACHGPMVAARTRHYKNHSKIQKAFEKRNQVTQGGAAMPQCASTCPHVLPRAPTCSDVTERALERHRTRVMCGAGHVRSWALCAGQVSKIGQAYSVPFVPAAQLCTDYRLEKLLQSICPSTPRHLALRIRSLICCLSGVATLEISVQLLSSLCNS